MQTLLITGASGFIGGRTARLALERGYRVRTLSRREWDGPPLVPVRERFLGELPFGIPRKAFEGVDTLVHLAHTMGAENEATARAVNVEGARRLAQIAAGAGVRKIIYISSQSAREDAISAYGKTKIETERALLAGPLPVVILRPGLVYGPGTRDLFSRMAASVRRLPALPLIGGGRALVQPIHADDLAECILRCVEADASLAGAILRVGDPNPITLADFLQRIAVAQSGRRKIAVSIPIAPLMTMARIAESLHIPLPITTNNLQGLKIVERMETGADLARIGVQLRPLDKALGEIFAQGKPGSHPGHSAAALSAAKTKSTPAEWPVRVALIGAGRIAMLHTVTMQRLGGIRLAALIDRKPGACKFLQKAGINAPAFTSLEEARRARAIDAALIATPPQTHLPIASECLAAKLPVFVEKPMSPSRSALEGFRRLSASVSGASISGARIQSGYWAPSQPHIAAALARLAAGEFGRPCSFEAFSLQSLFPSGNRWESDPAIAGGGVLINLGGHVLSLIVQAFGRPRALEAAHRSITSARVEDSLSVIFQYDNMTGIFHAGWAIDGFPTAENRLLIRTDRGTLLLNNMFAAWIGKDGRVETLSHQMDYDVGFNLSPDYIGGGIASELTQFADYARGGGKGEGDAEGGAKGDGAVPRMTLERAAEVEETLFDIYAASKKSDVFAATFSASGTANASGAAKDAKGIAPAPSADSVWPFDSQAPPVFLDVRALDLAPAMETLLRIAKSRPDLGFQALASQARALCEAGVDPKRLAIVAPDFVAYARQLSTGNAGAFLRQIGPFAAAAMGFRAFRSVAAHRGPTFWAMAEALLAADLALLPRDFGGRVLVPAFLTDLAVATWQDGRLEVLLGQIRASRPRAAAGLQTNILPHTLNRALYLRRPPSAMHFLSSPSAEFLSEAVKNLRCVPHLRDCRLAAETGPLPALLASHTAQNLRQWDHGAGAVVVDPICIGSLAQFRRDRLADAWRRAFPGLELPASAL